MKAPLSYLDLVVATVRGFSPVPDFQNISVDRKNLAEEYLGKINEKYKGESSGNELLDAARGLGAGFLANIWSRLSPQALTMCGEQNIAIVLEALNTIEKEKIKGDFIETGVWRGGMPIIMRAFLQSVGDKERKVWVADSFKGLPEDLEDENDKAAHLLLEPLKHLAASREDVEKGFEFFGLKDSQVEFLEGWFKDTLKTIPQKSFALIRLDGDYYESTRDAIVELYPKLSSGGYIIIDDYNLPLGCKRAVDEYRKLHNISEPIIDINSQSVYWRKL